MKNSVETTDNSPYPTRVSPNGQINKDVKKHRFKYSIINKLEANFKILFHTFVFLI